VRPRIDIPRLQALATAAFASFRACFPDHGDELDRARPGGLDDALYTWQANWHAARAKATADATSSGSRAKDTADAISGGGRAGDGGSTDAHTHTEVATDGGVRADAGGGGEGLGSEGSAGQEAWQWQYGRYVRSEAYGEMVAAGAHACSWY
jgi:hypothetical protein